MRISKMALNYFCHDLRLLQRWKHGMELFHLGDAARYMTLAEIAETSIATSKLMENPNPAYMLLVLGNDVFKLTDEEKKKQKHRKDLLLIGDDVYAPAKKEDKKGSTKVFEWTNYTLSTGRNRVRNSRDRILAPFSDKAYEHITELHPYPADTIGVRVNIMGKELYQARKQLKRHIHLENIYSEKVGEMPLLRPVRTGKRLKAPPKGKNARYRFRVELVSDIVSRLLDHPQQAPIEEVARYIRNRYPPEKARQYILALEYGLTHPQFPVIRNYLKKETGREKNTGSPYAQTYLFPETGEESWERTMQ